MKGRPQPLPLLATSVALALLGDLLLRGASWGVNIGLWTSAVALAALVLTRPTRTEKGLGAIVVGFALLFVLRDSDALRLANGFAMVLALGALLLLPTGRLLRESSVSRLLGAPLVGVGTLATEAYGLGLRARDARQASPAAGRRGKAIFRGLLFAVPLLLVFGGLFASADAVFRGQIESLGRLDLDVEAALDHLLTLTMALFFVAGLLHHLAFRREGPPMATQDAVGKIGMMEIGIVLGSMGALFGSFLLVQFRFLFGAESVVRATNGLSYAQYARGGFFELVAVAALTLVVLAGAGALLRREHPLDETLYRWLGRILSTMVFAIVASALMRMRLYTEAFGLTELRIYATVLMLWLTLAFVWLFATTLAGKPRGFGFGLLAAGLGVILATNLANPDRIIVRTNLAKPQADFEYLKGLGDDAVLALRDMGDAIPEAHRAAATNLIRNRTRAAVKGDWRELDLARWSLGH